MDVACVLYNHVLHMMSLMGRELQACSMIVASYRHHVLGAPQ